MGIAYLASRDAAKGLARPRRFGPDMINPLHLDLRSLRLFTIAAEEGSLTIAADRVHLTISAASKRISALEQVVGSALFFRHAHGLSLTHAGKALHIRGRQLLGLLDTMIGELEDTKSAAKSISVWANTSAILQFLPADLAAFSQTSPDVLLKIEEQSTEAIVRAVSERRADIGVCCEHVLARDLDRFEYKHDKLVLIVPGDHPLATRRAMSFDQALDYDFIGLFEGSYLINSLSSAASGFGRSLKTRFQVRSFEGVCQMVAAGLGVSVLPLAAAEAQLRTNNIKAIPLTDCWADRTMWVVVRDVTELSAPAKALHDLLRSRSQSIDIVAALECA